MSHILEVTNLEVEFSGDGGKNISVDHVGFHVDSGEIVCIVGESGCGKSVTALSVMGLLGKGGKVTAGRVLFEGRDLLSMTERELDGVRGDRLTMIFQDPLTSLNPVFTIGSQMTESIRAHMGLGKDEARERALSLLKKVGLPDTLSVMKKYPHLLSGGMRQRVMIAMALSCNPSLLIADEPTTALDVTIQAQIMDLILELKEEMGMAVLLITHDMGLVAQMADQVLVMYAGQLIEQARVLELFDHPAHPYTRALLRSVPGIRDEEGRRLESIEGIVPDLSAKTDNSALNCSFPASPSNSPTKRKALYHKVLISTTKPVLGITGRPLTVEFIHVTAFSVPRVYSKPLSSRDRLGCLLLQRNAMISSNNTPYFSRHASRDTILAYCWIHHTAQSKISGWSIS